MRKSIQEIEQIKDIVMRNETVRVTVSISGKSFHALYNSDNEFSNYCNTLYRFACGGGISE